MTTINDRVIARARKKYGLTVLRHKDFGSVSEATYVRRRSTHPVKAGASDTVVQHITVTVPSGDFKSDVRVVERIGNERFGSGISYNWVVNMETGVIAEGQYLDAKGTHTINDKDVDGYTKDQNYVARAIAVLGMPETKLSSKAANAISGLIAAMIDEKAVTAGFDYVPHSLFAWKDCPCDSTRDKMPAIRAKAVELRKTAAPETRVSKARALLEQALGYLNEVSPDRTRVVRVRERLERVVKRLPKR